MITEDYEKKYKESLERARKIKDGKDEWRYSDLAEITPALTEIFPELAESEDEKIRKEIVECIETLIKQPGASPRLCDWLAYLEKQSDTLEEAAEEYENGHTFQRYDGGGLTPEYNATLAESFIAGAKWKELQMLEERVCWNLDFLKDIDEAEKPWIEAELWAEGHKDKVSNLNSAKFGYAYGYHVRDKQLKDKDNEKD